MKGCLHLLVLIAFCAVGIRASNGEEDAQKESLDLDTLQNAVTKEVLTLIEVAIKAAQYTDISEKKKAVGWIQDRLDNIKAILERGEPEPTEPATVYYEGKIY